MQRDGMRMGAEAGDRGRGMRGVCEGRARARLQEGWLDDAEGACRFEGSKHGWIERAGEQGAPVEGAAVERQIVRLGVGLGCGGGVCAIGAIGREGHLLLGRRKRGRERGRKGESAAKEAPEVAKRAMAAEAI